MAMHLLHKSRSGQLLALVVLFRLGAENPALKALLPHIVFFITLSMVLAIILFL